MCFGFEWLGRLFALDSGRLEGGLPAVAMFEPGTGEVLEIQSDLHSFHESELVEYAEAALAVEFHQQWLARGPVPQNSQCIGYRRPLFLGGADIVENLEFSDMDVYRTVAAQLVAKTRGLPADTPISRA